MSTFTTRMAPAASRVIPMNGRASIGTVPSCSRASELYRYCGVLVVIRSVMKRSFLVPFGGSRSSLTVTVRPARMRSSSVFWMFATGIPARDFPPIGLRLPCSISITALSPCAS